MHNKKKSGDRKIVLGNQIFRKITLRCALNVVNNVLSPREVLCALRPNALLKYKYSNPTF